MGKGCSLLEGVGNEGFEGVCFSSLMKLAVLVFLGVTGFILGFFGLVGLVLDNFLGNFVVELSTCIGLD